MGRKFEIAWFNGHLERECLRLTGQQGVHPDGSAQYGIVTSEMVEQLSDAALSKIRIDLTGHRHGIVQAALKMVLLEESKRDITAKAGAKSVTGRTFWVAVATLIVSIVAVGVVIVPMMRN